jgi:hypothetical protein
MSSGIVAFKDKSIAEIFSHDNNGQIFTFNELLSWVKTHPNEIFQKKMKL